MQDLLFGVIWYVECFWGDPCCYSIRRLLTLSKIHRTKKIWQHAFCSFTLTQPFLQLEQLSSLTLWFWWSWFGSGFWWSWFGSWCFAVDSSWTVCLCGFLIPDNPQWENSPTRRFEGLTSLMIWQVFGVFFFSKIWGFNNYLWSSQLDRIACIVIDPGKQNI